MKKRKPIERPGSDFYDEEYFIGATKSNYGKLNPDGGYSRKLYRVFKAEQASDCLKLLGYTHRYLPKNALVVGCAVGYLVEALQIGGRVDAYGIDISEYAINRGRTEGIKNLRIGDICEMHFKDKEFEVVFCMETLEHIPHDNNQLAVAIQELARVTKDYLVISTPIGADDNKHIQLEGDSTHFSVHTPNWWANEFEKQGLTTMDQVEAEDTAVIAFERC